MGKNTLDKFTNIVNPNSLLCHSSHLFHSSSASQILLSIQVTITPVPSGREKNQNNYVLCSKNSIHNDIIITNSDDIQSCETERKQNDIIPITSTPNHHVQRIATTSAIMLNLHTITRLPPVGKEYTCFKNDGKTAQDDGCIKSRIMTKVIDYVLSY